jgi:hypothetical protein
MCRADQIKATEDDNDVIFLDVIRKINSTFQFSHYVHFCAEGRSILRVFHSNEYLCNFYRGHFCVYNFILSKMCGKSVSSQSLCATNKMVIMFYLHSAYKSTWKIKIYVCMKHRYYDILIWNETDYMRRDVHTATSIIKLLSSGTWASACNLVHTYQNCGLTLKMEAADSSKSMVPSYWNTRNHESTLFWDLTQRRLVVSYGIFATTCR